jgi:arabinogalactan oligomer / maltooligosaccharide transport system permease protein
MADLRDQTLGFRLRREWPAYLFLLPTTLVLLFLNAYPVAYTIYISMTDFGTGGKGSLLSYHYVGLSNYAYALTTGSSTTWALVENSFFWAAGSVALFLIVGLCLATVLNQEIRGKSVYRTLILLPWAMPAFITILVWSNMWGYEYGIINGVLHTVGIHSVDWLQHTDTAWAALFITNLWLSFPFYTVVFVATMQAIPKDLYEAASIDGASGFSQFYRITLPFLRPTIVFVSLMGFLFTFNNFYPIYLITSGGPGISTQIFITESYNQAFGSLGATPAFSTAALYSVIDFLIIISITIVVIWRTDLTRNWLK